MTNRCATCAVPEHDQCPLDFSGDFCDCCHDTLCNMEEGAA